MYLKQQLAIGVFGTDRNSMLSFRASNSDDDLVVHLIMYLMDDYSNLYCEYYYNLIRLLIYSIYQKRWDQQSSHQRIAKKPE